MLLIVPPFQKNVRKSEWTTQNNLKQDDKPKMEVAGEGQEEDEGDPSIKNFGSRNTSFAALDALCDLFTTFSSSAV